MFEKRRLSLLQSHVPILLSTFTLNLPTDELINYAATAREMTIFQPFPLSISSNSLIITPLGDYLDQSTQLFFVLPNFLLSTQKNQSV